LNTVESARFDLTTNEMQAEPLFVLHLAPQLPDHQALIELRRAAEAAGGTCDDDNLAAEIAHSQADISRAGR
jgi:hypothetical protein